MEIQTKYLISLDNSDLTAISSFIKEVGNDAEAPEYIKKAIKSFKRDLNNSRIENNGEKKMLVDSRPYWAMMFIRYFENEKFTPSRFIVKMLAKSVCK